MERICTWSKMRFKIFTRIEQSTIDIYNDLIWNKLLPLKASLIAWRSLNKRISTKDNLLRRGLLSQLGSLLCSDGCSQEETIHHLFLGCDFFDKYKISFLICWVFILLTQLIWPSKLCNFVACMFSKINLF